MVGMPNKFLFYFDDIFSMFFGNHLISSIFSYFNLQFCSSRLGQAPNKEVDEQRYYTLQKTAEEHGFNLTVYHNTPFCYGLVLQCMCCHLS